MSPIKTATNSPENIAPQIPYRLIADNVLDLIWISEFTWVENFSPSTAPSSAEIPALPVTLRFTYFTPSVHGLLGYTPDEAVQLSLEDLLTPQSVATATQLLKRLLENEMTTGELTPPQTIEIDHLRKDGSTVACEATSVFLRDEHGRPTGALGITRDISQRKQSEEALRNEQRLLKQLLELQERDRRILAYEIHDGLVQQMTGALMHFETAADEQTGDRTRAAAEFQIAFNLLRESVHEARRLISGLRPPILDEYGIVAAVEYLANETRRSGIHVDFPPPAAFQRLARVLENAVFRIVQEALTNVRRHSQTDELRIELTQTSDRVRIKIVDQGVGFVPEKVPPHRFGLRGIRERARLLNGQATIESRPGQGTRIEVELPLILAEDGE